MDYSYDVMVAGHLCIDIIPLFPETGKTKIEHILRPGKLVNVNDAKISTGGPVSNTGLNLKRLGGSVCFSACVGDDTLGKLTIDLLNKTGNAEGVSILKDKASSYTVVVAPPGIDRIFLHNPGTNNYFTADDLNKDLIAKCRHFHFGYPPLMDKMFADDGQELARIFKTAKEQGATTSCDMTLPDPASPSGKANWRKILENILPYVDIHVPSLEESFYMLYPEEFIDLKDKNNNADLIDLVCPEKYSQLADEMLAMGAKVVTLKSGHRGFYIKSSEKSKFDGLGRAKPADMDNWSDRELWAPAFVVEKFGSATGSGDSSIAGLLTGYLKGLSIEDSLKYAVCLGYQNVCVLDAVSGIKNWDETTAMINSNMPTLDCRIQSDKWKFDSGLWVGPGDKKGIE